MFNFFYFLEKITSQSFRKDRPEDLIDKKNKSVKNIPKIQVDFEIDENYEDEPRRRKMESTERQLFNLFEERGIIL